jgi:heme oxygenase
MEKEDASSSSSLTADMSSRSRKSHSISDAMVNARLIVLYTDPNLYGRALSLFYHVFIALEGAIESCTTSLGEKRLELLRRLYRSRQFQSDLEFYLGSSWKEQTEEVRASNLSLRRYETHLHQLASDSPVQLLAHAYTQMMAILSGGQILKGMAKRNLKLPNSHLSSPSTQSFEYPNEKSASSLKAEFRSLIDGLGADLTTEGREAFLQEHLLAFRSNNEIMRSFKMGYAALLNNWTLTALLVAAFLAAGWVTLAR